MLAPERIGRYEVTGVLGEGAMGVVYRGRDPGLERDVALKVMKAQAADADSRARFQREARAVARLSHPNIVTVFEFGEHEERPFMAMELLLGVDLQRAIASGLRPDPRGTLPIVLQVLAGLAHAHEQGVVHRDLKPSNVFLPQQRAAKLTDFGLARLAGGSTATGGLAGTPAYMSPEQVEGARVGPPSDLFSVGLILYELVTGERAFRGDSIVALLYQITHESPDLTLLPRESQWHTLRQVVARAVARAPEARWPDAQSMHAALLVALRELGGSPDWQAPSDVALLGRAAPGSTRPGSWSLGSGGVPSAAAWSLGPDRQPAPPALAAEAAAQAVAPPADSGHGVEPATVRQPSRSATGPRPGRQVALPLAAGAVVAVAVVAVLAYLGLQVRGGSVDLPAPATLLSEPTPATDTRPEPTPASPVGPAPGSAPSPGVGSAPVAPTPPVAEPERSDAPPETSGNTAEPTSANVSVPPSTSAPTEESAQEPPAPLPQRAAPGEATVSATGPASAPRAKELTQAPAPPTPSARLATDRANALLEQGRYHAAADAARSVLAREPDNSEARIILEEADYALAIEACIADVERALDVGRREEAAERLGPCLAKAPGDARLVALRRRIDK